MGKIKLLFIISNMKMGGAQKVLSLIIKNLNGNKFESIVVSLESDKELFFSIPEGTTIYRKTKRWRYFIFDLLKIIKREKPNVIISMMSGLNALMGFLRFLVSSRIKMIARETIIMEDAIDEFSLEHRVIYKLTLNLYDKIIAQSDDMKNDINKYHGIAEKKIITINNAIVEKKNSRLDNKLENFSKVKIICVGRLEHQKGFDLLLQSLEYVKSDFELSILGDGSQKNELEDYIHRSKKLKSKVRLLGRVDNPSKLYEESDIFVLSSLYEGFPNVLLEAGSFGLPALVNNCKGGINEIINIGVNGEISNIFKPIDFANKLDYMINNYDNYSKDYIREYTLDKYSIRNMIKKYEELFEGVVYEL